MLTGSILLLLASALLHATAQAMIKGSRDTSSFSWLVLGAASLLGAPFLLAVGVVEPVAWLLVAASGILEGLYYSVLAKAYSVGEFSTVYPVSRGSAPLFVLLWAAVFLGERPSALGLAGMASVIAGIYLANLPSLAEWRRPFSSGHFASVRWAFATGLLISLYTTVDAAGMRYFRPAGYLSMVFAIAWLAMAPLHLGRRRDAVIAELTRRDEATGRRRPDLVAVARIALCSVLVFAAYGLVLAALKLSPASYVAPTREISVLIAAWIGVKRFGERGGRLRIASAALVALGIVAIAFAE